MTRVQVGDVAPDFSLPSAEGKPLTLSQFRGRAEVVLFFYPRDNTAVCTAQACSFRDRYAAFRAAGAEVIGVSSDSVESHQRFAASHQLPYHLVSDPHSELRRLYGVPWILGVIPGRVTYLIDRQGVVRQIISSLLRASKHVDGALEALGTNAGLTDR